MRYLKKRLTVVNKENNQERMAIVINRYVEKMSKKGWIPLVGISAGNSYFYWEAYVRMCLPKNAEEREKAVKDAFENGWQCKNGVWSL